MTTSAEAHLPHPLSVSRLHDGWWWIRGRGFSEKIIISLSLTRHWMKKDFGWASRNQEEKGASVKCVRLSGSSSWASRNSRTSSCLTETKPPAFFLVYSSSVREKRTTPSLNQQNGMQSTSYTHRWVKTKVVCRTNVISSAVSNVKVEWMISRVSSFLRLLHFHRHSEEEGCVP